MSRRNSRVIEKQLNQIDAIFRAHSADPPVIKLLEVKKDKNCDIHGIASRRGSIDSAKNLSRKGSVASDAKRNSYCSSEKLNANVSNKNRNSIASFTELVERSVTPNGYGTKRNSLERELLNRPRRESLPIIGQSNEKKNSWNSKLFKGMEHPSNFPNMLRSSTPSFDLKSGEIKEGRASSSNWNVNHFHNYFDKINATNLNRNQSKSISEKVYTRDYSNRSPGISPEPKKELHSILKHKKHDEEDLKEIIKHLSFDYIEKEMSQNGIDMDLMSNSDSSSAGVLSRISIPSFKTNSRRISVDSLDSRRSSRRLSDFSLNGEDVDDDIVTLRNHLNSSLTQVSVCKTSIAHQFILEGYQ